MVNISHSEAVAFWDCPMKWNLIYNKKISKTNIHLEFGKMAHKALETRKIPEEYLFPELKEAFNIKSWNNYFTPIFSELDNFLKDYTILNRELYLKFGQVKGVIDLICKNNNTGEILLLDYKFKAIPNSYLDIYLDQQLSLYAYLYKGNFSVSYDNIKVGYISIPKAEYSKPELLRNGKLSKNKSQLTTKELYLQAIKEYGLDIKDYGDILKDIEDKKLLNIVISDVDENRVLKIIMNIALTISLINKGIILENFSAEKCKNCDYLKECKYDSY